MSFFGTGPNSIESTTIGVQATLSSASLLAEVDVNGTNASAYGSPQAWGITWVVGTPAGGTNATFLLDHARSTSVAATGIINQTVVAVSSGSAAQFFTKHVVNLADVTAPQGHRFRVRLASSVVSAFAKIIAEPLA